MAAPGMTREGLAYQLLVSIASAEGKDVSSLSRDYVLPLVRDIVAAIDNQNTISARRSGMGAIAPELFKPATAA